MYPYETIRGDISGPDGLLRGQPARIERCGRISRRGGDCRSQALGRAMRGPGSPCGTRPGPLPGADGWRGERHPRRGTKPRNANQDRANQRRSPRLEGWSAGAQRLGYTGGQFQRRYHCQPEQRQVHGSGEQHEARHHGGGLPQTRPGLPIQHHHSHRRPDQGQHPLRQPLYNRRRRPADRQSVQLSP